MASLTQPPPFDHLPLPPSSKAAASSSPASLPPHEHLSLIGVHPPASPPASSLPGFSSYPLLQELDEQSPAAFGSFHHDMPPAPWYQAAPANVGLQQQPQQLLSAEKPMMSSFGVVEGRMLASHILETNSSPASLLNLKGSPELMGSPLSGGTWEMASDQKLSLPVSQNPLAHPLNVSGHGLSEGSSGRELVGRLEDTIASRGVSSLLSSSPAVGLGQGIDKMFNLGWSSLNAASNPNLTVDPDKGSLAIPGVNLSASHCLANFTSDPGFAERAARFSCFSNQGFSEEAASFPLTEGGKMYPRSVGRSFDKSAVSKLARMSGFPPARSGPLRRPSGDRAVGELQDACAVPDGFGGRLPQDPATRIEDGKITGRASCSPARIEAMEATTKLGSSVNESDEGDESSSSGQGACEVGSQAVSVNTGKKRKNGSKDKPFKEAFRSTINLVGKDCKNVDATDDPKGKRYKGADDQVKDKDEDQKLKVEQSNSGNSGDSTPKSKESTKPPDAPKPDYIHVRARRGQATDSHSLAERVRREKISERMKFLQDLVPGCSKVTGKAVMLDEIINYVQSLQRQVEFLSMKLAAVNPRLDLNIDSFFNKEMIQPRGLASGILFGPDNTSSYPSLHQPAQGPLQIDVSCGIDAQTLGSPADSALRRTNGTPLASMDAFGDRVSQHISHAWDDELQSVVQMGFGQGRLMSLASQQALPGGRLQAGHMKVEL